MKSIKTKRQLLQIMSACPIWIAPIIHSITLPAHAATSPCSESNMIGWWAFSFNSELIHLNSDGSTNFPWLYRWTITNGTFQLNEDGGDYIYDALANYPCSSLSGSYHSLIGGGSGNWNATKQ